MAGLLINTDVNLQDMEKENIVETISNSSLLNQTENYNNTNVKQQMIKDYVTNLVTRNVSEQEVQQNISNNLSAASNVNQSNKRVFNDFTFDGAKGIRFTQVNKTASEIAENFETFRQDCIDAVNDAIDNTDIVTQVEDAMNNGNYDSYLNDLIAESEKKVENKQKTETSAENYTVYPGFTSRHWRRREHGLLDTSVSKQKIKEKSRNTDVTNDVVNNVAIASVVSNTELYSNISQAYNKTVETVNKIKTEVKQSLEAKASSDVNQSNEEIMSNMYFGPGSENITFEQMNDASVSVAATALVQAVTEMSSDNNLQAISSDMLGITEDFTNKNETKGETKASGSSTTDHKNDLTSTTGLAKSHIGAIVGTIAAVIVLIVVAIVVMKIMQSRSPAGVAQGLKGTQGMKGGEMSENW